MVFLAALGFFGVVVDAIPYSIVDAAWYRPVRDTVEDFGEHLVLTGVCWWGDRQSSVEG